MVRLRIAHPPVSPTAHGVELPNAILCYALGLGGFTQLIAGMLEFSTGNTFGATVFTTYGLCEYISYLSAPFSGHCALRLASSPAGKSRLTRGCRSILLSLAVWWGYSMSLVPFFGLSASWDGLPGAYAMGSPGAVDEANATGLFLISEFFTAPSSSPIPDSILRPVLFLLLLSLQPGSA